MVRATWEGSQIDRANDVAWVAALNAHQEGAVWQDGESAMKLDRTELRTAQREDPNISELIKLKESGRELTPEMRKSAKGGTKRLMYEWGKLVLKEGILHRKTNERCQLVLSAKFRQLALKQLHDDMGHVGTDRVLDLARR